MNTHLPSHRAALKKGAFFFGAAAIYLLSGTGVGAAGPETARSYLSHDLGGSDASLSLSGGTLSRGGRSIEVFAPLHVTTKSLRDFGVAAQEGGFVLYKSVFRAWDNEWVGFTFTITVLPETSAVVALSALLVLMLFWPDRRRLVKISSRSSGCVRRAACASKLIAAGRMTMAVPAKKSGPRRLPWCR